LPTILRRRRDVVPASGDRPEPGRRQRRLVLIVAAAATVFSAGGVIGATFVRSPEQQRASVAPPDRTVLTSPVEKRVLASTIVTRGRVGAARQVAATPATPQGAAVAVVTLVRTSVGATVRAGDVPLTVSGRPLVVLTGALPAYRDLRPGDDGADIGQLQKALRDLGHYRGGDDNGHFGPRTKAAVRRLYAKIGFSVPDTGGAGGKEDRAALRAAEDAVITAESQLAVLRARAEADPQPSPEPGAAPLDEQVEAAEAALRRARTDRADLIASTGTMMPLAEVVFLPTAPAVVTEITASVGDPVEAPLITFATGSLGITVEMQPDQADLLRAGMPVEIHAETAGGQAQGKITKVGELTARTEEGSPEARGPFVPVTITPGKPLPSGWNGLDVRVTITAAQTDTEVLVVPLSAVSASADGRTTVTVVGADGAHTRVDVQPGVSGDGFVEVTAAGGGLTEGDEVVVGT
jgi:peptidoglycan hydrolase-like protein with peptidoglycan-binding domain